MLQKIVKNFKSSNSLDHFYRHPLSKQKVVFVYSNLEKNYAELPKVIILFSPKENSRTTNYSAIPYKLFSSRKNISE